jgi:orotate phosphoribosyltransferase/AMMECR1 domain-containing protein
MQVTDMQAGDAATDGGGHGDRQALYSLLFPTENPAADAPTTASQWRVVLHPEGAGLAARALLALLADFESNQLAGVHLAGAALVSACVLEAGGRYTGLMVRPHRKNYGPRRQVEGQVHPASKVVIVTDVLHSGRSFLNAARALEENGIVVEGLVALAAWPHGGGAERARGLGYRVGVVFELSGKSERQPKHVRPPEPQWSASRVPDGLHPAHVVRMVAVHFLQSGEILTPPATLQGENDGRGGVFVSLRRKSDDHRVARSGFWHFYPQEACPAVDVVLAAMLTIQSCRPALTLETLAELKIAVTFFSGLELVPPAALDFERYGIVVRSRSSPAKMGGALPDTQYFTSTLEQYRHARETNARISAFEPHDVFRHRVAKCVEPGAGWPAFGVGGASCDLLSRRRALGEQLLGIVRSVMRHEEYVKPLPGSAQTLPLFAAVVVTLYSRGIARSGASASADIETATAEAALAIKRSAAEWPTLEGPHTFTVSVLEEPQKLGLATGAAAAHRLRAGRDSLSISEGKRSGLLMHAEICQRSLTKQQAAIELARRAGITTERAAWTIYKTTSWASRGDLDYPLEFGARAREPGDTISSEDALLMADHLHCRLDANGWPACYVDASTGGFRRMGQASWCIQALQGLLEAGLRYGRKDWEEDAMRGLGYAVRRAPWLEQATQAITGYAWDAMADAWLLCTLSQCMAVAQKTGKASIPDWAEAMHTLALRIACWIRTDGSVLPEGTPRSCSDQDSLPGAALLSLATYCLANSKDLGVNWPRIRDRYLLRFELLHPLDLARYHCPLWLAVSRLTGEAHYAEAALAMADWMCANQLDADGSFLCESSEAGDALSAGPSSHVASIACGISSAWQWAVSAGDTAHSQRYQHAWTRAMVFLDRLLVRRYDTYWMPLPSIAVGGIRTRQSSYELKSNSCSDALAALLNGLDAQKSASPGS